MSGRLEVTILGSGSSGGVPRADGDWGACDPAEPRNRRSRCSLLVRRRGEGEETTIVVDTAPEMRLQTAAAGARRLDAVLLTHEHADQTHGLDDVRPFFQNQRARIPCFMDEPTTAAMRRRFGYAFEAEGGYPAILDARALPPHGSGWTVDGPSGPIPVASFEQTHGQIVSAGFRFGPVAYSADVDTLDEAAFAALAGVKVWIVDALRWRAHPSHANVETALAWIDRVRPERAILTDLHIDLDYADLAARLPAGVEPAYDGLRFELDLED